MRWGMLWRTLLFELKKSAKVIQVCMLLHNFIIDSREAAEEDSRYFSNFEIRMDEIQQELTRKTGEMTRPVVTDNNEPREKRRPSKDEVEMRRQGEEIRHRLTVKLAANNMHRPMGHNMSFNSYGHIYMTS